VNILCVAGSRGERAKLSPVIACLEGDHEVACACISRQGRIPTWNVSAPPPASFRRELSDESPVARVAAALRWLAPLLEERRPDLLLTCGHSDAALGAALAASLADVSRAHLDAGALVGGATPNARLLDRGAAFLLASHVAAVERLASLGMADLAYMCGDTLADGPDAAGIEVDGAPERYCLGYLGGPGLESAQLPSLLGALDELGLPALLLADERARTRLEEVDVSRRENIRPMAPLDYVPMQAAISGAAVVITDSPTVQRESFFRGTVVVGLSAADFSDGERTGWVRRVAMDERAILEAAKAPPPTQPPQLEAHRGASARAARFVTGL